MDDALFVLLGAVVGAAASFFGSVMVNRNELKRNARVRLFRDLIPAVGSTPPEALYREAVLAGRRERQLAKQLVDRAYEASAIIDSPTDVDAYGNLVLSPEEQTRLNDAQEQHARAVAELAAYVEKKIR